jgi:hypothetical protein
MNNYLTHKQFFFKFFHLSENAAPAIFSRCT